MKIKSSEYVGSFVKLDQLPVPDRAEIAMAGRSNVGKSSLINQILNRKNLAKSSSTPGKTRTINYYDINQAFYLVDLPGYGYAKVSKTEQRKWKSMLERYLLERENLKGVLLLIDIRHVPGENDLTMYHWLLQHEVPLMIVANKADKLSRSQQGKSLALIRKALELPADHPVVSFSASNGQGKEEIWESLTEVLNEEPDLLT